MRPKAFDQIQALDAAMTQFWEAGYEGSSMQALVDRMDISRQSLYDTYGNKRELFEAALNRYRSDVIEPAIGRLLDPEIDPVRAIRQHLEAIATGRDDRPAGCLVVRAAAELSADDGVVAGVLDRCVRELRAGLAVRIREGQRSGSFDRGRDSDELAASVLAAAMGLQVMNRLPQRGIEVRPTVDTLMAALRPCSAR